MAVLTFDGLATPGHCSAPDWVAVQAAGQRTRPGSSQVTAHRLQLTSDGEMSAAGPWAGMI